MLPDYRSWLLRRGYKDGTITTQLYRVARVENHYGDLDRHFASDGLIGLLDALRYSNDDERRDKSNPTRIPFRGVARTNLASYRNAVQRYLSFLTQYECGVDSSPNAQKRAQRAPSRQKIVVENPRTLVDFGLDGRTVLEGVIANSQYLTLAQAVASLTLFSSPDTVEQTGGHGLFPTVRNPKQVGQYAEVEGRRVMFDDNKSATDAFLWANALSRRGRDTQFNHIYSANLNPDAYTSLANICMTPAFIAKLTDTSPEICSLIQFRSFDLYAWTPKDVPIPFRPEIYDSLDWAPPLSPIKNVAETIADAMKRKPKDRTVIAATQLGWLFSSLQP